MKKLISLFLAVLIALPLYSNEPEYVCIGRQYNTVIVNVPSIVSVKRSKEHSIKVTNRSYESCIYEIMNDTLVINTKNKINYLDMVPDSLEIKLHHPNPSKVNITTSKRGLNLIFRLKSGNQN